ncbi:orotate phosphoribosyltransferase [Spirobacillus cienkowskii]|jgi:orotate phosphoribosyltransferase|uniref:Orotate phosphoribosyltransferase n=1 Tax=Spirobacillus cienkowskii TaxID=495820 RepID=A0A369KTW7_9BACT|nr:MAG: hypothetical protein DCC88_01975 [Spirobacillus cienkowskii]
MILDSVTHDIVRGFFEAKVIQISTNPMFTLSSGKEAPVYLDHRKIFSHVGLRNRVIAKWVEVLKDEFLDMNSMHHLTFAGTATAGIAPAYALAQYCNAGFVYVRGSAKQHGLNQQIEGALPTQALIVLVDDMVTTGASLCKAAESLTGYATKKIIATSITTHNLKSSRNNFSSKQLVFKSLFNTTDILDIAYAKDYVTSREMKIIMEWLTQLDE